MDTNKKENEQNKFKPNKVERKVYQKPLLEELGDLRALTLGVSPGVGDSADPVNFQP